MRSRMLPPILPRPMSPSCMWLPLQVTVVRVLAVLVRLRRSAREADRHDDVAVARVRLAVDLRLAAEHRRARGLREGQPAELGADGAEAVEEEAGVERDLDVGTGERGLHGLARLGVLAGAGLDGHLPLGEAQ